MFRTKIMISWEKASIYNFLIIFFEKTTDLLYNVAIPSASGYDSMLKNIGSVQNKGYELSIESDNLSGAFSWTTAFNISFNRNKVLELGGETCVLPQVASWGKGMVATY